MKRSLKLCFQIHNIMKKSIVNTIAILTLLFSITASHGAIHHTKVPALAKSIKASMDKSDQLTAVFDNYFAVKDALVKTDGTTAATKATALLLAINAVKMDKLEMDVHMVWMKVMADLKKDAQHISETKDAKHQREYFNTLSKNIYALLKVCKQETPVYYQFCPMANNGKGANWLSKESAVKNPYYGSMMLTCGKTVETIK